MVPDFGFECVPGVSTGDADYFASNGDLAMQVRAGDIVYTNAKYLVVLDSVAANVPDPEPEPPKPEKKEPFYSKFQKKRKNHYLAQK